MWVMLDSTVLIDQLRGRTVLRRLESVLERGDDLCTSAVNVEEVVRGLRPKETAAADRLFSGLMIVPLRRQEAELAGGWRRRFASRGVTLSQVDCLIAAATHTVGGRLATGNPKHFPMREVSVEHWPVGR